MHVCIVAALVFFMFGTLGMSVRVFILCFHRFNASGLQLFKGKFRECEDDAGNLLYNTTTGQFLSQLQCEGIGGRWYRLVPAIQVESIALVQGQSGARQL